MTKQTQWLLLFLLAIVACQDQEDSNGEPAVDHSSFALLDSAQTGVGFINQVQDRNDFNGLTYRNFYNGGGVAIGDINNDDLPDLFFTANLGANRLYLNKGDFSFEDITATAGVSGTRAWSTGVTMADVNADGLLDIYVCNSGDVSGDNKQNELFINQGDLTFREMSAEYGLNNSGFSTQASFFDYDLDGDLDCYLLNNSFKDPEKIELFRSMRDEADELGGDKLYRNDGDAFTDVTSEAGIYSSAIGFGLGASIGDINADFLPDIYVSNDFWERDYLYINQGDGTFSEELIDRISYCSISSMGGDIADINNDGHPEIISTDMLAADNYRLKAMSAFDPYHLEDIKYRANYHYQIAQNCLHLNDGEGNFQEIAMLSGVAATDWSWGALFFDFENDGYKDLFVSNGLQRDLMYLDFRDYMADRGIDGMIAQDKPLDYIALTAEMPSNPLANFAFSNQGGLNFSNTTSKLGLAQPSFSNGSAYGDLDGDGDFDLVVNNVNEAAFIYRNGAEQTKNRFLKIKFEGPEKNPFGVGAHVRIHLENQELVNENYNSRGFQSSVEPSLLFGLGDVNTIEKLIITWPGGRVQELSGVEADQTLLVKYSESSQGSTEREDPAALFVEAADRILEDALHVENVYSDFDTEILQLSMLSTQGPRIISGDVNGDNLDDFLLLGAFDDQDKLFIQQTDGNFRRKRNPAFDLTKVFESTCASFLDFDQDGDLDLMIGSGGNEPSRDGQLYTLRYYDNDGDGQFNLDNTKVPPVVGNFSTLEVSDIDDDGDPDLFLGARVVPGNYGLPPRSYVLRNQNGRWEDISPQSVSGAGMITDAEWVDIDGDEDEDLVIVGEWMSVLIYTNEDGQLLFQTEVPNSKGWWTRIASGDLDEDGDLDLVLGNWGTNTKMQASPSRPLSMHVNDFDGNGKTEFIVNWYPPLEIRPYPFATKPELTAQLPYLRKQVLKFEDYASETYETLFNAEVRKNSIDYSAERLESSIMWNNGGGFTLESLPTMAQISPVYAIIIDDLDEDGFADIWLGGNMYDLKPQLGRQDASRGVMLLGGGGHQFEYMSSTRSGIQVPGQVRDAAQISVGGEDLLVVARNNAEAKVFRRR